MRHTILLLVLLFSLPFSRICSQTRDISRDQNITGYSINKDNTQKAIPGHESIPVENAIDKEGHLIPGIQGSFKAEGYRITSGKNGEPVFMKENSTTKGPADSIWHQMPTAFHDAAYVYAMAVSGRDLYIGGRFNQAVGVAANNIVKYDGSKWSSLGIGVNDLVTTIAVNGNDVYAGGSFTIAGGISANKIAKWDGSKWSPLGSGVSGGENPFVAAIAVNGNDVYAGGSFTIAGGISANRIAKWDGSKWFPLGKGITHLTFNYCTVCAIFISGSDVYAGGEFTEAGEVSANNIAKWDGSKWSPLGNGVTDVEYPYVNAISVCGSDVYAGGRFTKAGKVAANHIVKWDGSTWSPLGNGVAGVEYSKVNTMAIIGNELYIAGRFTKAGEVAANYIAKWDGNKWSSLGSGLNYHVYALGLWGNSLFVGGEFSYAGGKPSGSIAWLTITSPVSVFDEEITASSYTLNQNYPNPFNPSTVISYEVPVECSVTLKVYDMLGKEVRQLVNERKEAGKYQVTFNSEGLRSGVYFYSLSAGDNVTTKKMLMLK